MEPCIRKTTENSIVPRYKKFIGLDPFAAPPPQPMPPSLHCQTPPPPLATVWRWNRRCACLAAALWANLHSQCGLSRTTLSTATTPPLKIPTASASWCRAWATSFARAKRQQDTATASQLQRQQVPLQSRGAGSCAVFVASSRRLRLHPRWAEQPHHRCQWRARRRR